jgi:hypothetical protein
MNKLVKLMACCLSLQFMYAQTTEEKSYLGQLKNKKFHGFGVLEYADGSVFQGNFINGKKEGIGTLQNVEGEFLTGIFSNDQYKSAYTYSNPWHMLDIYYESYELSEAPFQSYAIDFELNSDVSDTFNLYLAPFGLGAINGVHFYGGIQTHCGGYKDVNHKKNNSPFTDLGRSIIFSRWDETDGKAIVMEEGGVCEIGDDEGNFLSVRNRFEWSKGKYTITVYNTSEEIMINEVLHTLVGMKIYDHQTGLTVNAGKLAFPGKELYLKPDMALFAEMYNEPRTLDQTPTLLMKFDNFRFNDQPVDIIEPIAIFPYNLPQWADARCNGNTIEALIGHAFIRNSIYFTEEDAIIYLRDY